MSKIGIWHCCISYETYISICIYGKCVNALELKLMFKHNSIYAVIELKRK